jgi:hypothetical protein
LMPCLISSGHGSVFVRIHVVAIDISWPHREANMHPERSQQLAARSMFETPFRTAGHF